MKPIETRDYQVRLIDKVLLAFNNGARHVLLESPTGSGKTICGLSICKRIKEADPKATFGWVAMRRKLLLQAEKENERVGVKDISFVSMFDKNPPKFKYMISDECLPGYVKVIALIGGVATVLTMDDIMAGSGTHVLSEDRHGLIFQPITSRVDMGKKEIWSVELDNGQSLQITENGRVLANGSFEFVSDLANGQEVRSCCQTYVEEGVTTYEGSTKVRSDTDHQETGSASLCVRVWPTGSVEFARSLLSEVSVQSSSEERGEYFSDKKTRTNHQRNYSGGRKHRLHKEQKGAGTRNRKTKNSTFDQKTTALHPMALFGTAESVFNTTEVSSKQRIWERECDILNMFTSDDLLNWERNLLSKENCHQEVSRENRQVGTGSLVYGRRVNEFIRHPLIFSERESSDHSVVQEKVGNLISIEDRQASQIAISCVSWRECLEASSSCVPIRASKPLVQVPTSSCRSVGRRISDVRKTEISVRTYDIGVANTHCFFANGILVHNCQHDAAASMADMYKRAGVEKSLGLTATPFRTDRIKLSFDKIVNDCGVRFLIEKGYLSQFRQWVIPKWTPEEVTKHYLLDPVKWGKSVIYMRTLPLCDQTVALLRAGGVTAEVVHGGQSREAQDRIYDDFEEGRTKVLVNVYMLTEGFDAPDLQSVFVRDSGKLCTMQMAGRVLRKDPNNSKKVANIIQSEQTWYPYTKVAMASEEYIWQDETWRSISANELVEVISRIVKERILTMPISLPSYLDDSRGSVVRVSGKGKVSVVKKKRTKRTRLSEILSAGIFDSLPEDLDDGDRDAAAG